MTVDLKKLLADVVACAYRNLNFGEQGGNNMGPFIAALGARKGTKPAWCALLGGHFYRTAYVEQGVPPPAWLYRVPPTQSNPFGLPEPGAFRLAGAIARHGRTFADPELLTPGDAVLWKRPGGHHYGTFHHFDEHQPEIIWTVEGNVGRYPARVRLFPHDVEREPHFVMFASILKESL